MSNTNKILIILGIIILIIVIYNWKKIFSNNSKSTVGGIGTGIHPNTTATTSEGSDTGRFIKPTVSSTPRPISGQVVMTQIGCEGKGFYNCTSIPSDCSDATLLSNGCVSKS